jgi:hypothetical protein
LCTSNAILYCKKKKKNTLLLLTSSSFSVFFFFLVTHGFYTIQKTADTTAKGVWAPSIEYMTLMEWASAKTFRQETIKKETQQEKKENEN